MPVSNYLEIESSNSGSKQITSLRILLLTFRRNKEKEKFKKISTQKFKNTFDELCNHYELRII